MLHIQLLGDFRLFYENERVVAIDQARQQSLLAYLLLHHHARQSRQRIAFLFWPDTSEAQAQTNLRQLLHHLRRAWPAAGDFLQIDAKTLSWKAETSLQVDVIEFERAIARAAEAVHTDQAEAARTALTEAVGLYSGDLLPACYEDWLLAERERLRQSYLDALEQLVMLYENQRDYPAAIDCAHRFLRADPLHETTYRRLMRLHALNNDRASALRTYHVCTATLGRELGVEPNEDTQEAYARLVRLELPRVLRAASAPRAVREDRLIGRQPAWQKLQTAWRMAGRGQAHFVCIVGEAGIGKTRLAEEMLNWARQQGIAYARTRSYAAEGSLAYAPVTEWLRADVFQQVKRHLPDIWLTEAARLLPELLVERPDLPRPEPLSERWQRQRFFEALARMIMAANQPLLLVIDDLQWCDAETLEWLPFLLRFDRNARLLIVGTLRPEEMDERHPLAALLLHLRDADQLTEIELGPFAVEETTALAVQTAARPVDDITAQRLFRETEGNPLFIVETVRSETWRGETVDDAAQDGQNRAPQAGGLHALGRSSLPPKVYVVIQRRLAQLSPIARELAGLAAVIGRSFAFNLLARAGGIPEDSLVAGLDELWQRRIVRVQGANTYDFSHDRIREVAYAGISPARRRRLHRQVAQTLEMLHSDALDDIYAQLAAHCEHAGSTEQAINFCQRAATVASRRFAYAEAIAHLNKLLSLLETLPATSVHDEQKLDAHLQLGQMYIVAKGWAAPEVEASFRQARLLCTRTDQAEKRFWALEGLRCYWIQQYQREITDGLETEMLLLAQQTQNPSHLKSAFEAIGATLFHQGKFMEAHNYFQRAISLHRTQRYTVEPPDFRHDSRGTIFSRLAETLALVGYSAQAQAHIGEALAMTRALERPFERLITVEFAIYLAHDQRRQQEMHALVDEHSALVAQYHFPEYVASNMILRGWLLAQGGEIAEGINLLKQGLVTWYELEILQFLPYLRSWLVEAYGWAKQFEAGLALVTETLVLVAETGEEFWSAELHRLKGELMLAQGGSQDDSESSFQQALTIARQQGAKLLELRAAVSLARLWQIQGGHAEAHPLLAEVYGWFTEGFDAADLQDARTLLEELGQAIFPN